MRFDRVRTHHFVFLNHLDYGVKVSFPFYLYSSLHKNIFGYKKNPTLHEGLLLFLYEHFKAQFRSKFVSHDVVSSKETGSSNFSLDTKDVQSISSEEEEDYLSSRKKAWGRDKDTPTPSKFLCRKSPRGHGPKTTGQGEDEYNEEGEDMDTDDEYKGEDDENREELVDNPKKKQRRMKEEDMPLEGKIDLDPEIYVLPLSPFPPQEQEKEKMEEEMMWL